MPTILEVFHDELEVLGMEDVKVKLLQGHWSPLYSEWADEWVRFNEGRNEEEAKRRIELREEESLYIARRALDNSRLATRIAISAIVLSIIMAIYELTKVIL